MTQEVRFQENSQTDGRQLSFRKETLRSGLKTIVDGWALFELPFEVQEDNSVFGIFLQKKNAIIDFWYDEAMIREQSLNLYHREQGWVVRNNYWHKLPKF